jgi:hypothetical protein
LVSYPDQQVQLSAATTKVTSAGSSKLDSSTYVFFDIAMNNQGEYEINTVVADRSLVLRNGYHVVHLRRVSRASENQLG